MTIMPFWGIPVFAQAFIRLMEAHNRWVVQGCKGEPPNDLAGIDITRYYSQGPQSISRAFNQNDLTRISLHGASLENIVAKNATLPYANLQGANLSKIDLSGADLQYANLEFAILCNANLAEANLKGAILSGADLSGAKIQRSQFQGADLSKARLDYLEFKSSQLSGFQIELGSLSSTDLANLTTPEQLSENKEFGPTIFDESSLVGADFSGVSIVGMTFRKANLKFAKLQKARFPMANMRAADLRGAKLSGISLKKTNLSFSRLDKATLDHGNLSEIIAEETNFSFSDLSTADLSFSRCQNAKFTRSNLGSANLSGASLVGGRFDSASMLDIIAKSSVFQGSFLTGATITNADLRDANLKNAVLMEANLDNARLQHADLSGANLTKASLYDARLEYADLSESNLTDANMQKINLQGAKLIHACLNNADLLGASLHQADLAGSNLRGVNLEDAKGISPHQLAGYDLTHSVLPERLAKSQVQDSAVRSARYARKLFTPLVLFCIFLSVRAFLPPTSGEVGIQSLGLTVPEIYFAWAAPGALLIWNIIFLYYMRCVWESLVKLPAYYPDGSPLFSYPDPWLLVNFIRLHNLKFTTGGGVLRGLIALSLIWIMVPITFYLTALGYFRFWWCAEPSTESSMLLSIYQSLLFFISVCLSCRDYFISQKILNTVGIEQVVTTGNQWLIAAAILGISAFLIFIALIRFCILS